MYETIQQRVQHPVDHSQDMEKAEVEIEVSHHKSIKVVKAKDLTILYMASMETSKSVSQKTVESKYMTSDVSRCKEDIYVKVKPGQLP